MITDLQQQIFNSLGRKNSNMLEFHYTLDSDTTTSAGVYDQGGFLIRTLWNNRKDTIGQHTEYWDRCDDENRLVANGNYKIKVLSSACKYEWEGVVGNSSRNFTGNTIFNSLRFITCMAFNNNWGYFGVGYREGNATTQKFNINTPDLFDSQIYGGGTGQQAYIIELDNDNVYWAGESADSADNLINKSYIFASKQTDDTQVKFANGVVFKASPSRQYDSAIGVSTVKYLDLAVQKNGNFIFFAREDANIYVYDKTGLLVQTLNFPNITKICRDVNGGLWIYTTTDGLRNYIANADGTLTYNNKTIAGLINPQAIRESNDGTYIIVADGGTSQQLKAYDTTTLAQIWVHGTLGGYQVNPEVNYNKWYFNGINDVSRSYIAFQPDGSFWVLDTGNERFVHLDVNRNFINEITYRAGSYVTRLDLGNPNRLFSNYLEYEIDYSKPLAPNNGSWKLKRNWRALIPSNYYNASNNYSGFRSVCTLSNGRTYFLQLTYGGTYMAELRADGTIFFDTSKIYTGNQSLFPDGTLRKTTAGAVGSSVPTDIQSVTGFDGNNMPVFGTAVRPCNIRRTADAPFNNAYADNQILGQKTKNGYYPFFAISKAYPADGYHLGALIPNGSTASTGAFAWKTCRTTNAQYQGDFPTDDKFDIGNGVNNCGSALLVQDEHIYTQYYGEFYKASQTNIWNHFHQDGLMLGQFGAVGAYVSGVSGAYGMAGNSITSNLIKMGDVHYIYHCDEGRHGGVHRWKISNLDSFVFHETDAEVSETSPGLNVEYFKLQFLSNARLSSHTTDNGINLVTSDITSRDANLNQLAYSVRWEGYITPKFLEATTFYLNTTGGARLWVDNVLLINGISNVSDAMLNGIFTFTSTKRLYLKLEFTNTVASSKCVLYWGSASLPQEIIPFMNFTCMKKDYKKSISLLDAVKPNDYLDQNLYGLEMNQAYQNTSTVKYVVKSNLFVYDRFKAKDISITILGIASNLNPSVKWDLGDNQNLDTWTLTGVSSFAFSQFNSSTNLDGSFFEIWDASGKVICRFSLNSISPYPTGQVKFNNKQVALLPGSVGFDATPTNLQNYTINGSADGIRFSFMNYITVMDKVVDAAADWKSPNKLVFRELYSSARLGRNIILSQLEFINA